MITKLRIKGQVFNLDAHRSITREQQIEELKNFICRPALFKATHNG
jgi:hypothetical protein